jgi:hypothetical protein
MAHKNPNYSIAYLQQEVGGIKIANTSATVSAKTMSLAVLSIRLQTTLLEALACNCKLDCN